MCIRDSMNPDDIDITNEQERDDLLEAEAKSPTEIIRAFEEQKQVIKEKKREIGHFNGDPFSDASTESDEDGRSEPSTYSILKGVLCKKYQSENVEIVESVIKRESSVWNILTEDKRSLIVFDIIKNGYKKVEATHSTKEEVLTLIKEMHALFKV